MNQILSRVNQIMTTPVKCQGRSSIPALTLSIFPVHLHGVAQHSQASTAKNKLDSTVEVLKTSLSDAYVMSTINLLALNLLMIFLRLNKRHQSLIICTI